MIESRQNTTSTNHFLVHQCRVASRAHSLHRTPCRRRGKPRFGEEEVNCAECTDWDGNMDPERIQAVEAALAAGREGQHAER